MANVAPFADIRPSGRIVQGFTRPFASSPLSNDADVLSDGRLLFTVSTSAGLRAYVYNADGTAPAAPIVVSTTALSPNVTTPFVATALPGGRFAVTWSQGNLPFDIYTSVFTADGTPLQQAVKVNSVANAYHGPVQSAATAHGGHVVTWTDTRNPSGGGGTEGWEVRAQFFDPSGTKIGGELLVNTALINDQRLLSTTLLSDGRVVVTWADEGFRQVKARFYTSDGQPTGGELVVSDGNEPGVTRGRLVELTGGKLALEWQAENSVSTIRVLNADGTPAAPELIVNATVGGATALANGNAVFVADGAGGAVAQIVSPTGAAVGGLIAVGSGTYPGFRPTVTALADGNFAVRWNSYNSSTFPTGTQFVRLFDVNGNPLSGATQVGTVPTALAPLAGGGFAIADGAEVDFYDELQFQASFGTPLNLKGRFTASDADAGNGVVTATLATTFGTINVNAGSSGVTVSGNGTATVTLQGTIAQIDAVLRTDPSSSVTYLAASPNPPATARLGFSINDNGNSGGPALFGSDLATIAIQPPLAPVIDVSMGPVTYVEPAGSAPGSVLVPAVSDIRDGDSTTLAYATVRISSGYNAAQDRLAAGVLPGGITASFDGASGTLTLTSAGATATLAQFQTALGDVRFVNTSDTPTTTSRTIAFQVNDGALASAEVLRTIAVQPTNDPAILDLDRAAAGINATAYTPGGAVALLAARTQLTDVDASQYNNGSYAGGSVTVAVQGNFSPSGVVSIQAVGAIGVVGSTVTYNGTTIGSFSGGQGINPLVVTLNGAATPAATQSLIQHLSYADPSTSTPGTGPAFRITLADGAGGSAQANVQVITAPGDAPLFGQPTTGPALYGSSAGWNQTTLPRTLGDINGDGRADIIAFGTDGVYATLATTSGFAATSVKVSNSFGRDPIAGSWTNNDFFYRTTGDVNGDGRADIIGFGDDGTYVSLSNGSGYDTPYFAIRSFGRSAGAGSWTTSNTLPRMIADVNGDGLADLIGFGTTQVYVSLMTSSGFFASPTIAPVSAFSRDIATGGGWSHQNTSPRTMGDVDGDGLADIIGFTRDGTYVSLATGGGNFATARLVTDAFGTARGWSSQDLLPRTVADVNGDGRADIIGFNSDGMIVALSLGDGVFAAAKQVMNAYGYSAAAGGWTSQIATPRLFADITGDGSADLVAFGPNGVSYAVSAGVDYIV